MAAGRGWLGRSDSVCLVRWFVGVGVNWWASSQWKVGIPYGNADLDRDQAAGNTKMLLTRIQWVC